MGSHVIDLVMLQNNFSTAEMRAVWNDEARITKQLAVEAALAQAEGELGLIPQDAAKKIAKVAKETTFDIAAIAEQVAVLKHSLMPTINALQAAAGDEGEFVHYGATTQDIVDTGTVLQLKDAYNIVLRDTQVVFEKLAKLAKHYQNVPMVGRTHGMQALPITFGYKLAIWVDEFGRHLERLHEIKERVFTGNINGAVGSYASFGPKGSEVERQTLAILDLNAPTIGWQSSRDRFSEYASVIGLISATLGKIGNEFYNLMRTEINEIEEPFSKGKIGSSTMPHKRNPAAFEGLASLTPPVLKSVALIHESMHVEHERDAMSWRQEWVALPEMNAYVSAQLAILANVLDGLQVKEVVMALNLEKQHGLLLSEKVMFEVGQKLGKQTAHHLVYECAMTSFEEERPFIDTLFEQAAIADAYTRAEVEQWLDPTQYTGLCADKVDEVLAVWQTKGFLKEG